jgi:ribosomal protein S18 acetylase RimI-like enzyme
MSEPVLTTMNQPSVIIRAANPTYDEGISCARYLNEAAEGFFRFMYGRRFLHIIAQAYIQPNNSYSFQNVSFATYDNNIFGMTLGYTLKQFHVFSGQPLKEAAGGCNLRMTAGRILCAPMLRIIETIADGDFYILAMAVDEDFRGKGVASALMKSIEKRARTSGSARLSLDVSANNKNACRVYEKWGMTVESQWPKRLPLPGIKFYRMAKFL